MDNVEECRLTD